MCLTPVTLPGSPLEESWAAASVIQQNVWSYMLVPPPSRSALRTGEVLGLPEVFQDEEPAHWPKAAGTPPPVQEPGGLQGGGECTLVMEPFYPLGPTKLQLQLTLTPPSLRLQPPMGEEGGRRRCHSSSAGDDGRRRRHPSNSTSKPTQPSKSSSSAAPAAQNAPKEHAQRTAAAAQGKKKESAAGGKKESVNKWSPVLVEGGQREDVMQQQIQRLQSCRPSVWARVDFTWFLICAFHLSASINRQSFNLCTWLLITFTKSKQKNAFPAFPC